MSISAQQQLITRNFALDFLNEIDSISKIGIFPDNPDELAKQYMLEISSNKIVGLMKYKLKNILTSRDKYDFYKTLVLMEKYTGYKKDQIKDNFIEPLSQEKSKNDKIVEETKSLVYDLMTNIVRGSINGIGAIKPLELFEIIGLSEYIKSFLNYDKLYHYIVYLLRHDEKINDNKYATGHLKFSFSYGNYVHKDCDSFYCNCKTLFDVILKWSSEDKLSLLKDESIKTFIGVMFNDIPDNIEKLEYLKPLSEYSLLSDCVTAYNNYKKYGQFLKEIKDKSFSVYCDLEKAHNQLINEIEHIDKTHKLELRIRHLKEQSEALFEKAVKITEHYQMAVEDMGKLTELNNQLITSIKLVYDDTNKIVEKLEA